MLCMYKPCLHLVRNEKFLLDDTLILVPADIVDNFYELDYY